MLQPVMHVLKQKNIILASGSQQRKELLEHTDLQFQSCPAAFRSNINPISFNSFSEFVEAVALQKVVDVKYQLMSYGIVPDVLIGAHTIVTLHGEILEKAGDVIQTYEMLSKLSGKVHTVYTGVVVKTLDRTVKFTDKADVTFKRLSETQMTEYSLSGESIGMAGGYCIKGIGATFVEKVEGDYFTVVGLPLSRLCLVLYKLFKDCI